MGIDLRRRDFLKGVDRAGDRCAGKMNSGRSILEDGVRRRGELTDGLRGFTGETLKITEGCNLDERWELNGIFYEYFSP